MLKNVTEPKRTVAFFVRVFAKMRICANNGSKKGAICAINYLKNRLKCANNKCYILPNGVAQGFLISLSGKIEELCFIKKSTGL